MLERSDERRRQADPVDRLHRLERGVTTGGAGGPGRVERAASAAPAVPGPAATRTASPMLLASPAERRRIDERKAQSKEVRSTMTI